MERISRIDFWNLIKPELTYYNKKWQGETEKERAANKKTILGMYYTELCHATQFTLESAFRQHRQTETIFPKIAQILKFAPKPVEAHKFEKHESTDMPDSMKRQVVRASGRQKSKQTDVMIRQSEQMIKQRFPNTNWTDAFARHRSDNDLLIERTA